MNKIYSTQMTNTGGRSGEVHSPDKSFALAIAPPGSNAENATNPEQLFAAGFATCFNSALSMILMREGVKAPSTVTAVVSLYEKEKFDYVIGVELEGHIEGMDKEQTEAFLKQAHQVCPYSKATKGNIEVTLKAI